MSKGRLASCGSVPAKCRVSRHEAKSIRGRSATHVQVEAKQQRGLELAGFVRDWQYFGDDLTCKMLTFILLQLKIVRGMEIMQRLRPHTSDTWFWIGNWILRASDRLWQRQSGFCVQEYMVWRYRWIKEMSGRFEQMPRNAKCTANRWHSFSKLLYGKWEEESSSESQVSMLVL